MELIYVWIDNYNDIIRNQEFNLSGKYRISYKDGKLHSRIIKASYPDRFFHTDNRIVSKLSNITALVGENGSGKTSLLQFLKNHLNYIPNAEDGWTDSHPAPLFTHSFILVIQEKGEWILYNHGNQSIDEISGDLTIRIGNLQYVDIYNNSERSDDWEFIIPELRETKLIYFSNVFDCNKAKNGFYYDYKQLFLDISTNTLFFEEFSSYNHGYQINEILRQIRFILSPYASKFKCKTPKHFVIETTDTNELSSNIERETELIQRNDWDRIMGRVDIFLDDQTNSYKIIHRIIRLSLSEYVNVYKAAQKGDHVQVIQSVLGVISEFFEAEDMWVLDQTVDNLLLHIKAKILELRETIEESPAKRNDLAYQDSEYFDTCFTNRINLIKVIFEAREYFEAAARSSIAIPFSGNEQLILNLITYCHLSRFKHRLLTFDLSGLSSGERAMLLTYSRFYWLIDRSRNEESYRASGFTDAGFHIDHYRLKSNLILLIDEGEVLLHPNWQREYLSNMIQCFNELFNGCEDVQHVQVILTSNSPFVVSDLPKENIILLENRNGLCTVKAESEQFDTFGANIHMLLSNSFFMSKGLIGEFAKRKINEVIEDLRAESDLSDERKRDMEFTISIIGEPIIKAKLQEMYNAKMNQNDRLKKLDSEIARLHEERQRILGGREEHD